MRRRRFVPFLSYRFDYEDVFNAAWFGNWTAAFLCVFSSSSESEREISRGRFELASYLRTAKLDRFRNQGEET